jgi:hypothetical protein
MISAAERDRATLNSLHAYSLHGVCLRSHSPLPFRSGSSASLAEVVLVEGSAVCLDGAFQTSTHVGWFHRAELRDGAVYLRWANLFDFLVSADGREIGARPLGESSPEAFHTYLLGQALSFALIKQGFDPLHATTVTVAGEAVAFLGECGFGKSSLAATFLVSIGSYEGGLLQLREAGSKEILSEAANTGPGDAILFRIADHPEHRVTALKGTVPKTAFAGWFKSEPEFLSLMTLGNLKSQVEDQTPDARC